MHEESFPLSLCNLRARSPPHCQITVISVAGGTNRAGKARQAGCAQVNRFVCNQPAQTWIKIWQSLLHQTNFNPCTVNFSDMLLQHLQKKLLRWQPHLSDTSILDNNSTKLTTLKGTFHTKLCRLKATTSGLYILLPSQIILQHRPDCSNKEKLLPYLQRQDDNTLVHHSMMLFSVDSSQNILRSFFLFLVVCHLNVFLHCLCIHSQMMKMCPFAIYFSIYF